MLVTGCDGNLPCSILCESTAVRETMAHVTKIPGWKDDSILELSSHATPPVKTVQKEEGRRSRTPPPESSAAKRRASSDPPAKARGGQQPVRHDTQTLAELVDRILDKKDVPASVRSASEGRMSSDDEEAKLREQAEVAAARAEALQAKQEAVEASVALKQHLSLIHI